MNIMVAAAGTAGHINPALSIANKLKKEYEKKNEKIKILFIGTTYGLENELVPNAGYELKQIEAYGMKKNIDFENFKNIIKTFLSILKVRKIIKEFNPDVVIGTGGFVCVPTMFAAKSMNKKIVLHESNAYPGLAVRLFDKKADKILLGLERAKTYFKKKTNLKYVGNPSTVEKKEYNKEEKNKILTELGLSSEKRTILVFGGSQGAQKINDAVCDLVIENIKNQKDDYQLIWATGKKQFDRYKEKLSKENIDIENIKNVKVLSYIYNMNEILNVSDLAVVRAGAMTITELSVVGLPAIFIPLPNRKANRQEENAKVFEINNAGYIIKNEDITKETLKEKLELVLEDKEKLKIMKENANKLAPGDVLEDIYREIMKIV